MGSGYRTFTAGEVLTASNVQNYLQDQVVMTFGGSAARSSAIGTANFEEGMTSYLTDTDKLEVYNGTNWVGVAPTTTQGLTLINTTSFSAVASQSFNNVFSATYTNYRIVFNVEHTVGLVVLNFRLRVSGTDATGANYNFQTLSGDNTISGGRSQNQTSSEIALISTSVGNNGSTDIYRPFLTNQTSFITQTISAYNSPYGRIYWGEHTPATSYDGFTIFPPSGNMTGTVSVYGYNK
jgi:hypothetical protein